MCCYCVANVLLVVQASILRCMHHFAQPSTMGANYVHNFLGDTIITPPEQQQQYTEKLIYLPSIFLSTSAATTNPEALTWDPNLQIPRAGLDLPMHDVTLMCNFNAFYKIHPRQVS
jgi:protein O-GlcNAc transferase